jgi:hypothetical protein
VHISVTTHAAAVTTKCIILLTNLLDNYSAVHDEYKDQDFINITVYYSFSGNFQEPLGNHYDREAAIYVMQVLFKLTYKEMGSYEMIVI